MPCSISKKDITQRSCFGRVATSLWLMHSALTTHCRIEFKGHFMVGIQEYLIVILDASTFMRFAYVGRFSAINFLLITKPPRKPNCRNFLIRPIRIVHSKMIITASYISFNIKQKEFGLWLYDTRSYYRRNFSHVIPKSF